MFEKSFGVALMAALVWSAFHFFGEIDNGPRAVIAQAPIYNTDQVAE
jgi:hypothetical protein